jgi:uncharacterized protein with FMN-binding domain
MRGGKGVKALIILAAVIVVLAVAFIIAFSMFKHNLNSLSAVPVTDIDTASLPDGTYEGSYARYPIAVIVEVTIKDGKYESIRLVKHDNGQGKAAELITDKVVEAQSLDVDAISGATYSSRVILLAIEDALKKAA